MLRNSRQHLGTRWRPGITGRAWKSRAQTFNEENPYQSNYFVRGYGHTKKDWQKAMDQVPRGKTMMNREWRGATKAQYDLLHQVKENFERGLEGLNQDLDIQQHVAKHTRESFRMYNTWEYQGDEKHDFPALLVHNRIGDKSTHFEADGLNQFSAMFQIPVITDTVPDTIATNISKFNRFVEQEKITSEYLKIAQNERLFYQDPVIMDKLKPIESFHRADKKPWAGEYKSRERGGLARHEGKSKFQEQPWLIYDFELDEPKWSRWAMNMVKNFLNRATFDICNNVSDVSNQEKMIAFRTENMGQMVNCLQKRRNNKHDLYDSEGIAENVRLRSLEFRVDRAYCDVGRYGLGL